MLIISSMPWLRIDLSKRRKVKNSNPAGSTFDRVWIKKERLPQLLDALDRFIDLVICPTNGVETTLECLDIIKAEMEKDPELIGVCFDMSSATEAYWIKYVPLGDDDYDSEILNIFSDKNNGRPEMGEHWEIGDGQPSA